MKLSIDAFGASGFPRSELAEAVGASFSATSYVGPEPTMHTRNLLRQYLEALLGLSDDFGVDISVWTAEHDDGIHDEDVGHFHAFDLDGGDHSGDWRHRGTGWTKMRSSSSPVALLSGTALLCLVCAHLPPPAASLANRAAKSCSCKIGVVRGSNGHGVNSAAVKICELITDTLLNKAAKGSSILNMSNPNPNKSSDRRTKIGLNMEFFEAAVWILRSCGQHERAIDVMQGWMDNPVLRNQAIGGSSGESGSAGHIEVGGGRWSQIKYESYTAAHLGELWSGGDDACCRLVLKSSATRNILERNPQLGLSIFTAPHPQNEGQWAEMVAERDPLSHPSYPMKVVDLLKSAKPAVPFDASSIKGVMQDGQISTTVSVQQEKDGTSQLPLESGRALAVTYLESAIGISAGRPINDEAFEMLPKDDNFEERAADLHDELSYLLLEGVIAERGDDAEVGADEDTNLGGLYRAKLRRLLSWPNAKIRSERILSSLPSSFLREHALLLGRLGRHEDALRILYCDLRSLDLALEYCDARHERQRLRLELGKARQATDPDREKDGGRMTNIVGDGGCAYLPLVRVALESDPDSERGTKAAIQVLALRRGSIDRGAALRLLPQDVPVSAVARPFLIPALVDSESQVRRLAVISSLLRARYVKLKRALTEAQIQSQASLHAVPALRSLNLGDPIHSSKAFKARPAHSPSSSFPDVIIIKHFFPHFLIIQAKVTNSAVALDGRTLGDVAFVVAESSDEALLPTMQVPLKTLPPKCAGSVWCVLAASPQRLDGTAVMTCELRYTVLAVDTATGAPLSFSSAYPSPGLGRTYVEELQDIEASHNDFMI